MPPNCQWQTKVGNLRLDLLCLTFPTLSSKGCFDFKPKKNNSVKYLEIILKAVNQNEASALVNLSENWQPVVLFGKKEPNYFLKIFNISPVLNAIPKTEENDIDGDLMLSDSKHATSCDRKEKKKEGREVEKEEKEED